MNTNLFFASIWFALIVSGLPVVMQLEREWSWEVVFFLVTMANCFGWFIFNLKKFWREA